MLKKLMSHGNGIKIVFSCSACVHQNDTSIIVRYYNKAHLREMLC